jgi:hypothetical protein
MDPATFTPNITNLLSIERYMSLSFRLPSLFTTTIQVPVAVIALVLTGTSYLYLRITRRKFALPPGPKPLPIVGNLFDVPSKEQWRTYKEWSEHYGMGCWS